MMNKWWGYLHTSGTLQAKRFFSDEDIYEAQESPFCAQVVGRVDMADAEKVRAWEADAIQGLKDAEKRKCRREMQASMTEAMNEKEKEGLALMLASPLGTPAKKNAVDAPKEEVA